MEMVRYSGAVNLYIHVKLCREVRNPPTFKTNSLIGTYVHTYISFCGSTDSVKQQSDLKLVRKKNITHKQNK